MITVFRTSKYYSYQLIAFVFFFSVSSNAMAIPQFDSWIDKTYASLFTYQNDGTNNRYIDNNKYSVTFQGFVTDLLHNPKSYGTVSGFSAYRRDMCNEWYPNNYHYTFSHSTYFHCTLGLQRLGRSSVMVVSVANKAYLGRVVFFLQNI